MIGRPDAPALPGSTIPRSRWHWTASRREAAWGWFFVSPWIIGFVLFTAIPMALALYFSLTDFDLRRPDEVQFVGLANYAQLLRDPNVLQSLSVTLRFAVITVPPTIALAVGLAVLLNSPRLFGRRTFRTLFYMPTQIPLVASTLIWAGVLNAETGWVNGLLGFVGVSGPDWLNDPGWVLPSLGIVGLWGIGAMMLIALAGIQSIPTELYDAAKVDGAGAWTTFRRITLPLLSPVLFYSLLISCVGVSQYFIQAYVLKNGQPDDSTLFYNVNLYREAFSFNQLGYASALAWVLFLIVLGLAMLLFWSSSRWVFYAGERR
jgi:ABC-type sugar transport system permease subunit